MTNRPKVSIILPSLNVVSYIRECVESVLNQTLKDIEIICVDAGSTDGTLEILREFEAKDSRVKVLISDVKSYGHQMNMGFDAAHGEYLGIVETDDWVVPSMYRDLYKIVKKNELDFIKSDFYRFKYKNGKLTKDYNRLSNDSSFYNRVLVPGEETQTFKFIMNTWSGIYRLDFLRQWNIRHNETLGASYQDNGFWFMTFCRAERAMFVDRPYYMNRRDNPNSSVFSTSKVYCMRDEYDYIRSQIEADPEALGRFLPLCNYFRFCGYYYNTVERISPELRRLFLEYFSEEFRALADANELERSLFSNREWGDLQTILYYPDRFLEESLRRARPFKVRESYRSYCSEGDNSIRVSVIVPVYNVEKYLAECLESVLAQQEMPQFEVICIDDGSTDGSASILDAYAGKDARIKVIKQANSGVASAHNVGLAAARGEYICLLDADDTLAPHAFKSLVALADKKHADVVVFGFDPRFHPVEGGGAVPEWLCSKNPVRAHTVRGASPNVIFGEQGIKPFAWRDFIRRDFLAKNEIWYWEGCRFGEDTVFQFELFPKAEVIAFTPEKLYRYRCVRSGSLMDQSRLQLAKKVKTHISVIAHLARVWESEGYFKSAHISFVEWAVDYFYDEFCNCKEADKRELARRFMPVLRGFLSETQQRRLGPGRQERIEEVAACCVDDEALPADRDETSKSQWNPIPHEMCGDPYISVIVPVHNNELTLGRTLHSLTNQTLGDIEIICVDDASTDRSLSVLHEWAQVDGRIVVMSYTENRSASQARKDAVLRSRGRYVVFCDADDSYVPGAFELLKSEMESCPVDVLHFGVNVAGAHAFEEDRQWIETNTLPFEGTLEKADVFEGCFRAHLYGLWNKMVRSEVAKTAFSHVEDGLFPRGQDVYAYFLIAFFAQSYRGVSDLRLYTYYLGEGLDGTAKLDVPTFARFCSFSRVVEALRRFLEAQKVFDIYADVWVAQRARMLGDCVNKWYQKVSDEDKGRAFDEMLGAWPAWLVSDAVARRFWNDPKKGIRCLETSSLRSVVKEHPKTVAMYYHNLVGGGVERVMQLLAPLWVRMGYTVLVITDVQGPDDFIELPDGVKRVAVPNAGVGDKWAYICRAKAFVDIVKREHVDVMIYHAWNTGFLPWDMLATKAAGASFVVHCHSVFSMRLLGAQDYFRSMPAVFGFADAVVDLSAADHAFWGTFNSNTYTVVNPIDPCMQSVTRSRPDVPTILWVGRLEQEKRPEDALRIFAQVHKRLPDARLNILGKAKTEEVQERLERLAEELHISNHVGFCGFQEQMSPYYQRATVLLGTSEYEGFSLAILEALAHAVPVVMYELPYLAVVDGNDGVVSVPQSDISAAASALIRLFENPDERNERADAAYQFAQKLLSFDYEDAWRGIFASLGERRAPVPLTDEERLMWDTLLDHYAVGVRRLRGQCSYLQKRLGVGGDVDEINRIHASASYRIGRVITWPARKLRTLVACYREHGLSYTIGAYARRIKGE